MKLHWSLFLFIISAVVHAQYEPTDWVGLWYLDGVAFCGQPADMASDVTPEITPILIIKDDLSFTGSCACNSISGTFTPVPFTYDYEILDFERTFNTCASTSQTDFESEFFNSFPSFTVPTKYRLIRLELGISTEDDLLYIENDNCRFLIYKRGPDSNNQIQEEPLISLYPNPSKDSFYLNSPLNLSNATVTITNIAGVLQSQEGYSQQGFDVTWLPKGIYVVTVKSAGFTHQLRLVKL